jgi:hypothetical protein
MDRRGTSTETQSTPNDTTSPLIKTLEDRCPHMDHTKFFLSVNKSSSSSGGLEGKCLTYQEAMIFPPFVVYSRQKKNGMSAENS